MPAHHLHSFQEKQLCCGFAAQRLCCEPSDVPGPLHPHPATAGVGFDPKMAGYGLTNSLWLDSESVTQPILSIVCNIQVQIQAQPVSSWNLTGILEVHYALVSFL